ncbi:MAG: S8 family serine peptidase [Tunicatimonas sp.]
MLKFFRCGRPAPLTYLYQSETKVPVNRIDQDAVDFAPDISGLDKRDFSKKLGRKLRKSRLALYKIQDMDQSALIYPLVVVQMQNSISPSILKELNGGFDRIKFRKLCFAPNLYLMYNFRNADQAGNLYNLIEARRLTDNTLVIFAELQYTPITDDQLIALVHGREKTTFDLSDRGYLTTLGLNRITPEDQTINGKAIAIIDAGFHEKEALIWPPVSEKYSGFFDINGTFFQRPQEIPQHYHGIMCAELVKQAASREHLIFLANADKNDYAPPFAIAEAIAHSAQHECLGEDSGGADVIVCSLRDANTRVGVAIRSIWLAVKYANQNGRFGKGTPVFWAAADESSSGRVSSLPEVIAVGATNQLGTTSVGTRANNKMDFSAPGQKITIDQYTDTGTSFAAPLAAGLAARILANYPNLSHLELRAILRLTCIKLAGYPYENDRNNQTGYGLMNYPAALKLAGQFNHKEQPYVDNVQAMVCQIKAEIDSATPPC